MSKHHVDVFSSADGEPKLGSERRSTARSGRRRADRDAQLAAPFGIGGYVDGRIEDAQKLTNDWPVRESASTTSRLYGIAVTFLILDLKRPGRVPRKDARNKQNQGHVSAVCVQCVDRVKN